MDTVQIISLGQQALTTTLLLASPILLIGLAAAIITAFIQTLFQMQEATVPLIVRLLTMLVALIVLTPWIVNSLLSFSKGILVSG